jgi:hypothetical protein
MVAMMSSEPRACINDDADAMQTLRAFAEWVKGRYDQSLPSDRATVMSRAVRRVSKSNGCGTREEFALILRAIETYGRIAAKKPVRTMLRELFTGLPPRDGMRHLLDACTQAFTLLDRGYR